MNKFFLLISFSFMCFLLKSQTNTQSSESTTDKAKQSQLKARSPQLIGVSYADQLEFDNVNDEYLGHRDDYLRMFINQQIPADFPKYSKTMSIDDYKKNADTYLMLNSALLSEKYRNKYSKK